MKMFFLLVRLLWFFYGVFANDPFENLFTMGDSCLDVLQPQACTTTLANNFKSQNPPSGTNEPSTLVLLFTPTNPSKAEPLHLCGGNLPSDTAYDPESNTEIFIHGWLDGVCRTAWMREMKEQLFARGRFNVILIDWTWGNFFDYHDAAANCKVVGEQVGFIIKNIMRQTGVGPDKFHVIGHSFGAIAAGFVGRSVKPRRITGLDPALAPFLYAPANQRLTYRDAQIVDIIHSNGGNCMARALGDERQLGHADFYPNGGTVQRSCNPYIFTSLIKGDVLYGLISLEPRFCSHLQSLQYYKVSINPKKCQFVGVTAPSYTAFQNKTFRLRRRGQWAVMGMDYELYRPSNVKNRRIYFLKTMDSCPYYDNSYLADKKFFFDDSCSAE